MKYIEIFTDGACRNNQERLNEGGYGIVLIYKDNIKKVYRYKKNTTNNEMELLSVIEALKLLKTNTYPVKVYSDSAYVINCIKDKWYEYWRNNNWVTKGKKKVEHKDLWVELLALIEKMKNISFFKVKGHLSQDSKDFEIWYKKFIEQNYYLNKEDFIRIIEYNNLADSLANTAIEKRENV